MKKQPQKRRVEGYMDEARGVYVITADPDQVLSPQESEHPLEDIDAEKMKLLFKKYRPSWMPNENS